MRRGMKDSRRAYVWAKLWNRAAKHYAYDCASAAANNYPDVARLLGRRAMRSWERNREAYRRAVRLQEQEKIAEESEAIS